MGTCSSAEIQTQDTSPHNPSFKVAIIGDSKVGKTSVFSRYVKNQFNDDYIKTKNVAIVNVVKMINVPCHMVVSLTLWDTPGIDDLDLTETYFKDLDAVIVVVDVTSEKSLDMAGYWRQHVVNSLTTHYQIPTTEAYKLPVLLLANKYDKIDKRKPDELIELQHFNESLEDSQVDLNKLKMDTGLDAWEPECVETVRRLAMDHRYIAGVLVSAKESDGSVHVAMQTLIRHLVEKHLEKIHGPTYILKRRKTKKLVVTEDSSYLKLTGTDSVDEYITGCEDSVSRIAELKTSYERTLDAFKISCADAEIIPAENYNRASLEQCITALKLHIGDGDELTVKEAENGIISLYAVGKDQPKGDLARAMDKFNQCFAIVCAVILAESNSLKSSLKTYDQKIQELWKTHRENLQANDSKSSDPGADYKELSNIVNTNRIQIGESLLWIEELNKQAENCKEKVKASLMW